MTRVDPPPGLLDSIRANVRSQALDRFLSEALTDDARNWVAGFAARAAWDAVADQLQLTEEARYAYKPDCDERRLVSKWEQS